MTLDLATIRAMFDAVLAGKVTREEASNWARELREAHDRGELAITPQADWKRVWQALEFLEGYDLKISPEQYLHTEEDLIANKP